jgi:transcription initiation factor TFIID subunit 6
MKHGGVWCVRLQPLYGFASGTDPLHFAQPEGHKDVFFLKDKDLEFDDIINSPLPKCPVDVTVVPHWLAIEGVQPAIPENPPAPVEKPSLQKRVKRGREGEERRTAAAAPSKGGGGLASKGGGGGLASVQTEVLPVASHLLSKELQLYFERITELVKGCNERLKDAALQSLASDPGLHQLLPYFTQFISDEVTNNLKDLPLLSALMRMLRSLLLNPHHNIELYLHQLMPSVITCMVAKRLSKEATQDHWRLRDYSAATLAIVCAQFGTAYPNIQPRVTRTLVRAFLDPVRPLATHYGNETKTYLLLAPCCKKAAFTRSMVRCVPIEVLSYTDGW